MRDLESVSRKEGRGGFLGRGKRAYICTVIEKVFVSSLLAELSANDLLFAVLR